LFAEKGYVATSVRDIGKKVGIKDSSLYFYFKNKQAIMDSLRDRFIEKTSILEGSLRQGCQEIVCMNDESFMNVTMGFMKFYLMEPFINQFIRILIHEQSDNEELRNLYQKWCMHMPIKFQAEIFIKLQEIGFLKQMNSEYLAEVYYSPIFLYFHEHITYEKDSKKQRELFLSRVKNHVQLFLKEYEV